MHYGPCSRWKPSSDSGTGEETVGCDRRHNPPRSVVALATSTQPATQSRHRLARLPWASHAARRTRLWVLTHPLISVIAVAATVRVAAAAALATRASWVAPDEGQYFDLATSVANGHGANAWAPGYGQSLYDSTYVFTALLADLFRVFGPHPILGQLIAVVFGVVTAALTTWLALRLVPVGWALIAGLVAGLLPSQVLWSSIILRESMVWSAAAAVAVGLAVVSTARTWPRLVVSGLLCGGGLLALGFLREQTLAVAAWAALLALFTFRIARPWLVRGVGIAVLLGVTVLSGIGPMGYVLAERALPSLAVTRLNLSIGAASSFVKAKPVTPTATAPARTKRGEAPANTAPEVAGSPGARANKSPGPQAQSVVTASNGKQYAIDDSSADFALKAFPTGVLAVTARPYPWEATTSTDMRFAKLEDVAWVVLYAFAIAGVWAARRRRAVIAYPVLFTLGVFALGAVTQGNLGTAFRHRGQVVWALAPLAVAGLWWIVTRWRSHALSTTDEG